MTEPTAFTRAKTLTVGEIATLTGAQVRPSVPLDRVISGIAPLDTATSRDLSFLENPKYLDEFAQTRAGACLVTQRFADRAPPHLAALPVRDAYRAFVIIARTLFPDALRPSSLFAATAGGVVGASLHPSARLESGVVGIPASSEGAQTLEGFSEQDAATILDVDQIAAVSSVHDDIPPGGRWGFALPAKPVKVWFRQMRALARLGTRIPDKSGGNPAEGC
jgi:UDP-3-O-[3-hydroxymyristoyl] glucosamine N-acyltransferase